MKIYSENLFKFYIIFIIFVIVAIIIIIIAADVLCPSPSAFIDLYLLSCLFSKWCSHKKQIPLKQ